VIDKKISGYNAEVKAYQSRAKDYARTEQKRVDDDYKASSADRKAQAKAVYDRTPTGRDLDELNGQIDQTLQGIPAKYGDKVKGTIFADPKVDAGQARQLALELATSNPRTDGQRALAMLQDLTRASDEKPGFRSYTPRGRDILGNVIVTTDQFGPIHIRPQAWKEITAIAKRRNDEAVAAKANPPKDDGIDVVKGAEKGAKYVLSLNKGDDNLVNHVGTIAKKIGDRAAKTFTAPVRAAIDVGDAVNRQGVGTVLRKVRNRAVDAYMEPVRTVRRREENSGP
jgi:hypothetical protein